MSSAPQVVAPLRQRLRPHWERTVGLMVLRPGVFPKTAEDLVSYVKNQLQNKKPEWLNLEEYPFLRGEESNE